MVSTKITKVEKKYVRENDQETDGDADFLLI